ncbi:hypothetical protein BKA69DRAFT_1179099, partial [Paraphysoderma sedebokerense]
GGAGWKSNGAVGFNGHNQQCLRPLEGGFGGSINVNAPGGAPTVGDGGFGGGASAAGQTCSSGGPGGGGGYSGGAEEYQTGGAGWKSNGAVGFNGHNQQCLRPLEGGFGGSINVNAPGGAPTVGDGGFGGGASAAGQTCSSGGPGGGGGYSGGAGPFTNTDFTACSWWRRRFI